MNTIAGRLRKHFRLDSFHTTVRREVVAGITTFLTMAYIVVVNPAILADAGMDQQALITVTVLASVFGTLVIGLWANVPFAMAPGMGLNAFFAYTLVIGQQVTWQTALGVVLIAGVFFLLLSLLGIRQRLIHAIPLPLRLAAPAGIGLFIAFIGFQNLGLIESHPATLIHLAKVSPTAVLGLIGLLAIVALECFRVKGSILLGIAAATLGGMVLGLTPWPSGWISAPPSISPVALQLDVVGALQFGLLGAIFSFVYVDLFDSVGTIVACSYAAGLVEPDGEINQIDRMLEADAAATIFGALLGTSPTTTYIESGAGIAAGGRTGLTSLVTGLCLLATLAFTPLIASVPSFATAPALILVGVYMFRNIREIGFEDISSAVPAFLTIVMMPLAYNISTGLSFGFASYLLIAVCTGRGGKVHPLMWIVGLLSIVNLAL